MEEQPTDTRFADDFRVAKDAATDATLMLGPFDKLNMGRSVPLTWFYSSALDEAKLLASLRQVLEAYPVLCGRYDATPPNAIILSNAGIGVHCTGAADSLTKALEHLPASLDPTLCVFAFLFL